MKTFKVLRMGRLFVSCFLKLKNEEMFQGIALLHSLPPFPKAWFDRVTREGECTRRSPLFLPPLIPHLPSTHFPTTWLKSASNPSLLWTEPQSRHTGRVEPACRYCSSAHFSINVLYCWCHMCCPCVDPKKGFCFFGFFYLLFSSKFGMSSENWTRKPPPHTLYLLFELLCLLWRDETPLL